MTREELQYEIDESLFGTCESCGHTCRAHIGDESFDHEFGTQRQFSVRSDCCDEDVRLDKFSQQKYFELTLGAVRYESY